MSALVKHKSTAPAALSQRQLEKADASSKQIIEDSVFLDMLHSHSHGLSAISFMGGIMGGIFGFIASVAMLTTGDLATGAAASVFTVSGGYLAVKVHLMTDAINWPRITKVDAPGNKLLRRSIRKRSQRLDRKYGWRPRQGVLHPSGRKDTYTRYLLDVSSTQDTGYSLQISCWEYNQTLGWSKSHRPVALPAVKTEAVDFYRRQNKCTLATVYAQTETEMLEHYGRLSEIAIDLNKDSEQNWMQSSIDSAVSTEQMIAAQLNASNPGVH